MLSKNAIAYAWKQIFYRLGIEVGDGRFQFGGKTVRFAYDEAPDDGGQEFSLLIQTCPETALEDMLSGRPDKLVRLKPVDFLPAGRSEFPFNELPVLFWGDVSSEKFASIQGRQLVIHADVLAATFFMLSRYEEVHATAADKHGRFPFQASAACRYDLIDLPIVDIYALVLKAWLEKLTGETIHVPHRFHFHFSHDVDYMYLSHPFHKWLDVVARDLAKLRFDFLKSDLPALFTTYQDDPYFRDLRRLAAMAGEKGRRDVFYLLTSQPHFSRDGYSLQDQRSRAVVEFLKSSGMHIGLHTSYASFDQPKLFAEEKERLEKASGLTVTDARAHYLRVRTPYTWTQMAAAGLRCDESYSFSEREGFRCGTCYEYQVFDLLQDRELDFYERPLIVMDATLRSYRKLTPAQGFERIRSLALTCKAVNGTFTLLWHNACLGREWREWGAELPGLLNSLIEMESE